MGWFKLNCNRIERAGGSGVGIGLFVSIEYPIEGRIKNDYKKSNMCRKKRGGIQLKKVFSIGSFTIFLIGLVFYFLTLLGNDTFLLPAVIMAGIGFVAALFGEKTIYRKIGLFGNGLILVIGILLPFVVTTFFWNKP
jgi:hypothetical protein